MGMKLGEATLRRDRRQAIAVSEFPENLGGLLVADSTGLMVAMQYIAERKSLGKNLLTIFVTLVFIYNARKRAPFNVQTVKTRSFAASAQSFIAVFHIVFH
jgi:hypothetical protein